MEELVGHNLKIGVQIHMIDRVNDPGQQDGVEGKRRLSMEVSTNSELQPGVRLRESSMRALSTLDAHQKAPIN